MGALIQTKGTQKLAKFFNNQRFDVDSIDKTRRVQNSSGTSLKMAFAATLSQRPLLSISDNFIAQFATANATWVPNGKDVLYPAITLVAAQATATDKIVFNNPNPGFPGSIDVGISAANLSPGQGIPKGAFVKQIDENTPQAGQTTVTFNEPVKAALNDRISFIPLKHQNLVKRWRHFLKIDLQPSNHSLIQSAVLSALTDTSVVSATFQTIEHYDQRVLTNTEFETTNADDDNLNLATKYIQVALITPRTTAPDDLDDQ